VEECQGKVTKYVEEKLVGGLTETEIKEAEALMGETGECATRVIMQSRRQYIKELRKVIEAADVVIQVLDSRDPMGCRNTELEQNVVKLGKKMLLIVNKIDLVPAPNARAW
jgi:predicted GTPase